MGNQRISALPLKSIPDATDVIPIVDVQFDSANYINKKTTVGALNTFTDARIDEKIAELNVVSSVNGKGGNVILNLAEIGGVSLPSVANNLVLAYDQSLSAWTGRAPATIDETLDGGEF
jgi:hypothetical protein